MKGVKLMEDIILKMNLLGGMNAYVENLGDDDATDYWLTFGIPDGATEEDLEEFAKDNDTWVQMCCVFGKLVERWG